MKRIRIVQGQSIGTFEKADQLFQATEGEFEYQMQKKKYQVVYRVSDTTKWKVIGIIPLRDNICRFTADSETDDQDADDRDFYQQYSFVFIIL
ncbi:MAG: hypothetical protein ACLTVV_08370 [Ruminococcus sp.]